MAFRATLTRRDVEACLTDFLAGSGGDWDWDDFTSVPIADPALEQMRAKAAAVPLPLTEEGRVAILRLLQQLRSNGAAE